MSRILDYIAKYDENLTIAQLKKAIELEKISEKEVELEEINRVISSFTDVYVKEIDEESVFGRTLNVYHLKGLVRNIKTVDFTLVYYFDGNVISFSGKDINYRIFDGSRSYDNFSYKDLRQMQFITKEEYDKYGWEYKQIIKKLQHLIL